MTDNPSLPSDRSKSATPAERSLLELGIDQFREDCRLYNEAVGSYNTHLDNHRDRRNLHEQPFRTPITSHDAFEAAIDGDRDAIEALLADLLEENRLDSQLRRHPGTYPIHVEAVEHLEIARQQLITTLEELLQHMDASD